MIINIQLICSIIFRYSKISLLAFETSSSKALFERISKFSTIFSTLFLYILLQIALIKGCIKKSCFIYFNITHLIILVLSSILLLQSSQQYRVRFCFTNFCKNWCHHICNFSIAFVVANSFPHSTHANSLSLANIFSLNHKGCNCISSLTIVKQSFQDMKLHNIHMLYKVMD